MKHPHLLIGLGLLSLSAMPVFAKPAYVPSTVNLRTAPNTKSEIVAKIPGGSLVETKDCSEGWCEITWQDKTGFAIAVAFHARAHQRLMLAMFRAPVTWPMTGQSITRRRRRVSIISALTIGLTGAGVGIGGDP